MKWRPLDEASEPVEISDDLRGDGEDARRSFRAGTESVLVSVEWLNDEEFVLEEALTPTGRSCDVYVSRPCDGSKPGDVSNPGDFSKPGDLPKPGGLFKPGDLSKPECNSRKIFAMLSATRELPSLETEVI